MLVMAAHVSLQPRLLARPAIGISIAVLVQLVVASIFAREMSAEAFVRQLAGPSSVLSDAARARCAKLCEVLKAFLAERRARWLRSHQGVPIIECYASDGTPLKTQLKFTSEFQQLHVSRTGTSSKEWIVQRLFLASETGEPCVLYSEPLLLEDKTAWTHFEVQRRLADLGRQHHDGIIISHHCWDRALKSACEQLARKRHTAYDYHIEAEAEEQQQGAATLQVLMAWFACVGCIAHDFHNSLKWGTMLYLSCAETARSAWVVMQSLRSAYDLLVAALPRWLGRHISFQDHPDVEELARFWHMVGLSEDWAQSFVDLQMRLCDGRLLIAGHYQDDPELPQHIVTCVLHIWKFRTWSSSRWCGIGSACRTLLGCLFLGLESLAPDIMQDGKSSKYYVGGCAKHMTAEVKRMVGLVALTSRVSEKPLDKVLADDRLARTRDQIDECIACEAAYVFDIPDAVMKLVAAAIGMPYLELRHEASDAVCIQVGYAGSKLREARRLPWSLVGGDVRGKLCALRAGPRPHEEVAEKIWRLLRLGHSESDIMRAINTLGQAPWTTTCVEQGHSVASSIVRKHPKYNRETLAARAMLQQSACLFKRDKLLRDVGRCKQNIARLQGRRPERITGRHAYAAMLTRAAIKNKGGSSGRSAADISKAVIRSHGKRWKALAQNRQTMCHEAAAELQDERRRDIEQRLASEKEELHKLRDKQRDAAANGGSCLRLGLCRLTDEEKVDFEQLAKAPLWTKAHVNDLRARASEAVGQPSAPIKATIEAMPAQAPRARSEQPPWVSWICHHRDVFRTSIVQFERQGGRSFWRFVYAKQNPLELCFARALETCKPEPWFSAADYLSARGRFVCGDGEFQDLGALQRLFPEQPAGAAEAKPVVDKASALEPWMEHPTLWDFVRDGMEECGSNGGDAFRAKVAAAGASRSSIAVGQATDIGEDDSFLDELFTARARIAAGSAFEEADPFNYTLRGGRWTQANMGIAFDSFRARAESPCARRFCSLFCLCGTVTFSIRRYGEDACIALCRLWASKMTYLFRQWEASGHSESYEFDDHVVRAFVSPPDVCALAETASQELAQRIRAIEALRPRRHT